MLTFDSAIQPVSGYLDELDGLGLPDAVEVGETNDYWVYAVRSKKRIELVSKETGKVIAFCPVDCNATKLGLSLKQVNAARGVINYFANKGE